MVLCDSPDHPLANREFLFPYAAIVKVSPEEMARMPEPMGKTLVVSALTQDRALVDPEKVEVHEIEADVNDPAFALAMANRLHELISEAAS